MKIWKKKRAFLCKIEIKTAIFGRFSIFECSIILDKIIESRLSWNVRIFDYSNIRVGNSSLYLFSFLWKKFLLQILYCTIDRFEQKNFLAKLRDTKIIVSSHQEYNLKLLRKQCGSLLLLRKNYFLHCKNSVRNIKHDPYYSLRNFSKAHLRWRLEK